MWEDDRFKTGASTRWAQLRAGPWSDTAVEAIISSVSAQARGRRQGGGLPSRGSGQQSKAQLSWVVAAVPLRQACPCLQIKPAVLRSYDRWASVILKPWFPNSEVQWTTGEADADHRFVCILLRYAAMVITHWLFWGMLVQRCPI